MSLREAVREFASPGQQRRSLLGMLDVYGNQEAIVGFLRRVQGVTVYWRECKCGLSGCGDYFVKRSMT